MELAVLNGARDLIAQCQPYLLVENIKCEKQALEVFLAVAGYRTWGFGLNTLAFPADDPCVSRITLP